MEEETSRAQAYLHSASLAPMSGKWGQVQLSGLVSSRGGQRALMQSLDKVMSAVPVAYRGKTPSDGQEGGCCGRIVSQAHSLGVGSAQNHKSQEAGMKERDFWGQKTRGTRSSQRVSLCR